MRKSSKNIRTTENVIFGCDAEYRASKSKDGKSPAALKTTSSSTCHFFLHNKLKNDQKRGEDGNKGKKCPSKKTSRHIR
jgi:hypothetical protein